MATHSPTECGICQEEYDETKRRPRVLQCSHYFCTDCITQLIRNTMKTCPICRKEFHAVFAEDVMVNFAVLDFMKYLSAKDSVEISRLKTNISKEKIEIEGTANDLLHNIQKAKRRTQMSMKDAKELRESYQRENGFLEATILPEIRNIIERNYKKMVEFEVTDKRLEHQLEEIRTKENQLQEREEHLNCTKTTEETLVEIDQAKETNIAVGEWVEHLIGQTAFTKEILQTEKKELTSTKEMVTALKEALKYKMEVDGVDHSTSIPTMIFYKKPFPRKIAAEDLQNMSESMKLSLEQGKVFAVQGIGGGRRSAQISISENRLYLHHLADDPLPDDVSIVEYQEILRLLDASSNLAFLELKANGSTLGRMHISLYPKTQAAKQFMILCTAETGYCYANTNLLYVFKTDNREYAICGDYETNNGVGGKALVSGLLAGKEYTRPEEVGTVRGLFWEPDLKSRGAQFAIYTKANPKNMLQTAFGKVVHGLDNLTEAMRSNSDVRNITIGNCGLVLPCSFPL